MSPISSDATVNDGRWHHVALVLSNTFQALFLDGQNVGSTSSFFLGSGGPYNQIGTGYTDSSEPFTPGGWYGFRGQIDDVRIWSVERTADEIRQDMTTTLTGTEPGLSAYYSFDEGQGLTAHDATPNHYDGTLTGTNGDLPTWSDSSGLGIGLGSDGISSNSTKVRRGPNELQNDPVVVATTLAGQLTGWLGGSLPNSLYHLEFFAAAGYAPSWRRAGPDLPRVARG